MFKRYEVKSFSVDNYAVYDVTDTVVGAVPLFVGKIEEVKAWIELKEQGYIT